MKSFCASKIGNQLSENIRWIFNEQFIMSALQSRHCDSSTEAISKFFFPLITELAPRTATHIYSPQCTPRGSGCFDPQTLFWVHQKRNMLRAKYQLLLTRCRNTSLNGTTKHPRNDCSLVHLHICIITYKLSNAVIILTSKERHCNFSKTLRVGRKGAWPY